MDKQISHVIVETCKKLGINYKSCNPNYIEFYSDAQILGQLYKDLLEIAGRLQEISERHQIKELNQLLTDDIYALERIEHDLVKLSQKLKEEHA